MADQDDGVQLFGQCKICIVCSKDLDESAADKLAATIKEHGGEVVIYQPPSTFPPVLEFTHLLSTTVDFPAYQSACDSLIPVVKPQWVQASIARSKLANPRQYNPDPRLFMNDVVVTCGDIPEGDKDAIVGGVLAMGGLYSPRITSLVTHLVDLTTESDKAKIVAAKKLNTKIVLPHWFDDCLKLGRRIDERPYTLPDAEILRAAPDAPVRSSENKDIIGASTPDPSGLPSARRNLNVFEGKKVMLSSDLSIGSHLRASIEDIIEHGGGTITSDVYKADMFICRYREGIEYRIASRLNKDVGNLSWLYHLITHNTWTSPLRRLLHYPVSRTGIPGFKGLKISLSNYTGEARSYLENLITATGAECTKTLRQENTHLITAHGNSEKCTAAKEWGLQVVNHLWLEESYAKWKLQPVTDPRYTHFPKRTNLGEVVGQTKLDRAVLEKLFFPADDPSEDAASPQQSRVMQQKDQNATANPANGSTEEPVKSKATKQVEAASDAKDTTPQPANKRKATDGGKLQTPALSRFVADGKENATPSTTSSRKSKEAAAARLQDLAPDIALYEKEKKRVGGVIYGGRRKDDEDRITYTKKRRSMEAQDASDADDATEAKRQKKSRPAARMQVLITGYQRWVGDQKREDADKRQLRELGISVVQDARKCTHLAAPSILRTHKFVNALAYAPVIINVEFITQCIEKNQLLNPEDFLLEDKAAEEKYGFTLAEARQRAKENKNMLLQGFQVCCVESIRGGFDAFKSIVETNGGDCALFRARVSMVKDKNSGDSGDGEDRPGKNEVYLLSGTLPDQVKLWPRFRQMVRDVGKVPKIVRVDWLLDIAMSQQLRWKDEYELSEDMLEKTDT